MEVGVEGLQSLLPYRAYNINDMLGNGGRGLDWWCICGADRLYLQKKF
jgi:hypothetical protein